MTTNDTVSREEAAALLNCSVRTLDRHIPPGTPGRTTVPGVGLPGGRQTRIRRSLVEALMPAPGGDE
jgi:hypothetical protein